MILENAQIVGNQVLVLFMLILAGYLTRRLRMVNEDGIHQMTNILLVIVTPSVIILSFQTPFDRSLLRGILIAAVFAVLSHAAGALIAKIAFRNQPDGRRRVLAYSVVFSNCGFMCIPLLDAVLGQRGVFFGSIYIAVFSIAQWTYGIILMSGRSREAQVKRALINPGTVAILIALPMFLGNITLPGIPSAVLGFLAGVNTPLAMMIIGAQMAAIPFGSLFGDRQVYLASVLRLLAVPALVLLALQLLPLDRTLTLACLIPAAAPAAAATAIFATRYDQDTGLATRLVAISTLFSILTMPLLILLSDWLG